MRRMRPRIQATVGVACCIAVLAATGAAAQEPSSERPVLRVGTSGDYAPFSSELGEGRYAGFSTDLARRFAEDQGMDVVFVRFRWPDLLSALAGDRFDVAWSGITVRPERSAAGRFSLPVVETGAVALVPDQRWTDLDDLDRPQIRIGVNAGGHLERVTGQRFPNATHVAIPDNASVLEALRAGSVHVVVTDSAEAPHWIAQMEGLSPLGPFTRDRKAALVHPERQALADRLDAWLLARERDGTLDTLRREHLGAGPFRATAEPLAALLAAVDERLSLMPLVGAVKRASGVPIEVPEREAVVLDAAAEAVLEAASRSERTPPPFTLIRAFYGAQMEAAKQVQMDAVRDADYQPPEPWPDLDEALRPALLRLGRRIAALVLALPPASSEQVAREAADLLREPRLSRSSRHAIATAITRLLPAPGTGGPQPRTSERATSPATTGTTTQMP
ncbi:MAG: transporter substrate-binding domain-containing protein [Myxococcota bacterium]